MLALLLCFFGSFTAYAVEAEPAAGEPQRPPPISAQEKAEVRAILDQDFRAFPLLNSLQSTKS